jgi:hypothetical protein
MQTRQWQIAAGIVGEASVFTAGDGLYGMWPWLPKCWVGVFPDIRVADHVAQRTVHYVLARIETSYIRL